MDQAGRGAKAIDGGNFRLAVTCYTDAIAQNPQAVNYYVQRSKAYTRLSPPEHQAAFNDAEIAVSLATKRAKRELIADSQLRRAVTLFNLERYADAKQCLRWVKKLNEKEKSLAIWEMKTDAKLKGLEDGDDRGKVTVQETPDVEVPMAGDGKKTANEPEKTAERPGMTLKEPTKAVQLEGVQTPASKIRHEWFQTDDTVIVTLFCKGIPKDKTTVEMKLGSLDVAFPLPTGSDFNLSLDPLFAAIDPAASSYTIMSTKAEFTLKKATSGLNWATLEGSTLNSAEEASGEGNDAVKRAVLSHKSNNAGPAYPTSSKSGPKNWDKVVDDLSKKPKKAAKEGEESAPEDTGIDDEEGDPTTNFFKTLYKGADPDTQRAMMKSYQESNGTALSTNWNEVSKGKVETSPPDGMEARSWNE
ncbi:SGS domain-containing protein [Usnea florida]